MQALSAETKYINVARQYGLDDPRTYKNKAKLTSQAAAFKRKTGMNWPVGM
jgi:predicted methyltransferase MtxX (methanogen marker protein 4)